MITPKVSDIVGIINKIAPFSRAEEWDNVGLQVGDPAAPAERIMVALDPGRDALEAAVAAGCRCLLTHHPFIFKPLKRISLADPLGGLLALAIKNDLAVISLHTNLDVAQGGVNDLLAGLLGVASSEPLKITDREDFVKLAVFVPRGSEAQVLEALFRFSGFIGNYSDCSFQAAGTGTFKPLDGAKPFIGEVGKRECAEESRIEVLLRNEDVTAAVNALVKAHPYEEPAYDLYPLLNRGKASGLGRIGQLQEETTLGHFAAAVKKHLDVQTLRFVGAASRKVRKVALCGGSGAFLVRDAWKQGADVLVTGDVKYHEAREAEILGLAMIDAGHFATERPMIRGVEALLRGELANRKFSAEVLAFEGEREPFSHI
ncbi:MAG TPA: Nif3-like dinuclear metal center hexameric protein [Geobacteraceae bacterium]|nr:Nif3-like dinuclear metal center hexameric protein [Geobacteraceae bacterium]